MNVSLATAAQTFCTRTAFLYSPTCLPIYRLGFHQPPGRQWVSHWMQACPGLLLFLSLLFHEFEATSLYIQTEDADSLLTDPRATWLSSDEYLHDLDTISHLFHPTFLCAYMWSRSLLRGIWLDFVFLFSQCDNLSLWLVGFGPFTFIVNIYIYEFPTTIALLFSSWDHMFLYSFPLLFLSVFGIIKYSYLIFFFLLT